MRYTVLGAGAWGTALALVLASSGHAVRLWARSERRAEEIRRTRRNKDYLPDASLPPEVEATAALGEALRGVERVVVAVPVQHIRDTLAPARDLVAGEVIRIGAAKGIERSSLLRVSELLSEVWGAGPYAVLSGPSFALEVAAGEPTAMTVASDPETARLVQHEVATEAFRVYTWDPLESTCRHASLSIL